MFDVGKKPDRCKKAEPWVLFTHMLNMMSSTLATKKNDPFSLPLSHLRGPESFLLYRLYHILVIFVLRILRWSWKMPYMSASLVGGHPGT